MGNGIFIEFLANLEVHWMKKFIDKNLSREILYLFILKNKTFLPFEKFSQFFNLKIFLKIFKK